MQMVMSSLAVSMGQTSPPTTTALTQNAAPSATQAPLGLSENSSAVSDALATSPPANPVQALSSFMRSLMTALQTQTHTQAQSQSLSLSPTPSPSSTPPQGIAPHPGLQRLDSTSQIGTALQSLVTQLKTGPNPLQQSYSGLVSSLGGDPQSASLNQFLSHFEQQLQTMGPTGNLVNLTA